MKILIAVPTYETIFPDTFKSIWDLDRGGHEVLFEFVRGYDVATARNNIAQKAVDMDVDYVLMVDNDMVLPKETLLLLLENAKDICFAYCVRRRRDGNYEGNTTLCRLKDKTGNLYYRFPSESRYTVSELKGMADAGTGKIRIHGGGTACVLIRTEVFRKVPYPWFDWVNYGEPNRGLLSEDLYFCQLATNCGYEIYADVRAKCGHIFRYTQWPE